MGSFNADKSGSTLTKPQSGSVAGRKKQFHTTMISGGALEIYLGVR